MIIDGDPVGADIEGTGLQSVVNTNWDLFIEPGRSRYYLLDENRWLTSGSLEGPWTPTSQLPAGFAKLPNQDNWAEVHKALPAQEKGEPPPVVLVSKLPAELILTEGPVKLDPIAGTTLSWVANSEADLFFHSEGKRFYFLTSGRWFRSPSLQGPVGSGECRLAR